jgi:ferric-chelate reductase
MHTSATVGHLADSAVGFLALAQLPVIILLSLKTPLPLPVFLPSLSYEHYNFLHRWAGRVLFLSVTVHGGMWLNQFITTDQYDQVWAEKTKRGMIAYGLMGGIVITSLKPVRQICYQLFWIAQCVRLFTSISRAFRLPPQRMPLRRLLRRGVVPHAL